VPVDPRNELSKLLYERNFEKAFNVALQRYDLSIVSWLCSQVKLSHLTMCTNSRIYLYNVICSF
jgi:hypothetical protein